MDICVRNYDIGWIESIMKQMCKDNIMPTEAPSILGLCIHDITIDNALRHRGMSTEVQRHIVAFRLSLHTWHM